MRAAFIHFLDAMTAMGKAKSTSAIPQFRYRGTTVLSGMSREALQPAGTQSLNATNTQQVTT
jgi:hypothetical protein